ncbi:MAG: Calcium-binding acidic-repeat protein (ARP) [uncultured Sulfurovum sp.]|uniref:Calcium-binding acidic-repeat protein (ARP) n=1 Tax=uncultured Sulfurovum sp. TaxID=269237 RepID=A0A6S6SAE7_9BACT|nr:MAG: Calcium-binding acidic-repeat protein (ARP) [uncultured Sulfurovum sp.]
MYRVKCCLSLLILLLNPLFSSSIIYEDAEDKKTTNWSLVKSDMFSKIDNIYDKEKKSRVIQLIGEQTKSTYVLNLLPKSIQKNTPILSWEMNYAEDFVIMIEVSTTTGKHTLIYTAGNENSYLQYGLGETSALGHWKQQQRNLDKDLNTFMPHSKIVTLNSFVIKGSGLLDNIKLIEPKRIIKQAMKESIIKKENIQPLKEQESIKNKKLDSMPIIYLHGKNPLLLKKGESYFEAGASAVDQNGSELQIEISHQIDTFKEGEYSVIYMTTNAMGNSVIDRRRVIVGEVSEQKKSKELLDNKASLKLEERSEELSEWEEALKEREEELLKKEAKEEVPNQEVIKKVPLEGYPERPGL